MISVGLCGIISMGVLTRCFRFLQRFSLSVLVIEKDNLKKSGQASLERVVTSVKSLDSALGGETVFLAGSVVVDNKSKSSTGGSSVV